MRNNICQKWSSNWPHKHQYHGKQYSGADIANNNYVSIFRDEITTNRSQLNTYLV